MTYEEKKTYDSLETMVRRRHEGDGWAVFKELGNATGSRVSRHADLVAMGTWPSHGYEIFGYELKASRGDTKKELRDPAKSDAISRFCDYWYLVIADKTMIEGLIIPKTWGVLAPIKGALRVVRKAPKLKAKDVTRAFVAAMVANMARQWIPAEKHRAVIEDWNRRLQERVADESTWKAKQESEELARLKKTLADFESASGIKLHNWNAGNIGAAVEMVVNLRNLSPDAAARRIARIDSEADQLEYTAKELRASSKALQKIAAPEPVLQLELPVDTKTTYRRDIIPEIPAVAPVDEAS